MAKITQKKEKTGSNTYTDLIPDCASRSVIGLTSSGSNIEVNQILTIARAVADGTITEAQGRKSINNILASKNTGKYSNIFYDETTDTLKFWKYMATVMKTIPTNQVLMSTKTEVGKTSEGGQTDITVPTIAAGDVLEIEWSNSEYGPHYFEKFKVDKIDGTSSFTLTKLYVSRPFPGSDTLATSHYGLRLSVIDSTHIRFYRGLYIHYQSSDSNGTNVVVWQGGDNSFYVFKISKVSE